MARNLTVNVPGFGLVIALLSGCSLLPNSQPRQIEIVAEPIEKPELVLPETDRLKLREIDWFLITPENAAERFAEIERSGQSVVFFAVTADGYEELALNLGDIRSMIQQQQAIIAAYENYYQAAEEAIDNANRSGANAAEN